MSTRVYFEVGSRKVFACALDWPGWCRSAKTEEGALDALADYYERRTGERWAQLMHSKAA